MSSTNKSFGWQNAYRTLNYFGFEIARQNGSHVTLIGEIEGQKKKITITRDKEYQKGMRNKIAKHTQIPLKYFEFPKLAKKDLGLEDEENFKIDMRP